jgi:hypothetical protein
MYQHVFIIDVWTTPCQCRYRLSQKRIFSDAEDFPFFELFQKGQISDGKILGMVFETGSVQTSDKYVGYSKYMTSCNHLYISTSFNFSAGSNVGKYPPLSPKSTDMHGRMVSFDIMSAM